jgi:hypothetical protein
MKEGGFDLGKMVTSEDELPEGEHGGVLSSIGRETRPLNDIEKLLWGSKEAD